MLGLARFAHTQGAIQNKPDMENKCHLHLGLCWKFNVCLKTGDKPIYTVKQFS